MFECSFIVCFVLLLFSRFTWSWIWRHRTQDNLTDPECLDFLKDSLLKNLNKCWIRSLNSERCFFTLVLLSWGEEASLQETEKLVSIYVCWCSSLCSSLACCSTTLSISKTGNKMNVVRFQPVYKDTVLSLCSVSYWLRHYILLQASSAPQKQHLKHLEYT